MNCSECNKLMKYSNSHGAYHYCTNVNCSKYNIPIDAPKNTCTCCGYILSDEGGTWFHCVNRSCSQYGLNTNFNSFSKKPPVQEFESGAKREKSVLDYYDIAFCGIEALARIYTEGAARYGHDNWRKGLPVNETFNHLFNHLVKWKLAQEGGAPETEDNLAKVMWGVGALIYEREVAQGKTTRVINK